MRKGMVIVGVVLLVIGLVLMFVPLVQAATENLPGSGIDVAQYNATVTGFGITGGVEISVSWTASSSSIVAVGWCPTALNSTNECPGTTNGSGNTVVKDLDTTSGSATFGVPNGGYFAVEMGSINSTTTGSFTITISESTIGLILFVIGILLLIVGAVTKRKPKPAPMPAEPMIPPTPAPDTMAPPSTP
jgi:uncharacterized membrane protein